ncbi:MAG: deoxyribonuclease IV [Candidatus Binatus sp.]|uniref:deoxyribonuclease IV n=1 Tax=Candidatus Binatus sp. TaxID=2811406 RepID=UPI00271C34C3|nr:deoxyribonuclease IV [Candidatus Binatus sp.]MDO8434937.1 deoxyribonuclease IV [Candidatus Binatus sp.]
MAKSNEATRPLLGAHMSIAGEVGEALIRGQQVGCDCIQIFTKSSRQWASKPYSEAEIATFKRNLRETGIKLVIAHDSYLVNLGAPDEALRIKSVKGFIDELERCEALGVPILVAHPGAHVGSGEEQGIKTIAKSIDEAQSQCAGFKTKIALEITAGQGSNLGYTFQQMGQIFDAVTENERLRLCFDTEHAFAAGYDLRTDEEYEKTFGLLDEHVGLDKIVAFHLNDATKPINSRVDRHQHIGQGFIGLDAFRRLLNDERFFGIPMCLETPKGPDLKEDVENLATLRSLFNS